MSNAAHSSDLERTTKEWPSERLPGRVESLLKCHPTIYVDILGAVIEQGVSSDTLSVFKFAQYYFLRIPRFATLSTAQIIVRAQMSHF